MSKINDIDMKNWKESDVWTDSLWLINERDKNGKHDGFYHGNFVPQVPRQLIKKYSKSDETVLDPFLGSGTTAYEAESLGRNFIGIDIVPEMVQFVKAKLDKHDNKFYEVFAGDSTSSSTVEEIKKILSSHKKNSVQLAILHPPYADIIKFSDNKKDLSNAKSLSEFIGVFSSVLSNTHKILQDERYMAIIIGDMYKNNEWIPLGFYCLSAAQRHGFTLKSIVIKNMSGNRGKQNKEGIWKYRSLANDYYVFKHEYVLIFKKK